eukprot:3937651-Rhodomonas_salina.1
MFIDYRGDGLSSHSLLPGSHQEASRPENLYQSVSFKQGTRSSLSLEEMSRPFLGELSQQKWDQVLRPFRCVLS